MNFLEPRFSNRALYLHYVLIWETSREALLYRPNSGRSPRPGALAFYKFGPGGRRTFMGGHPWWWGGLNGTQFEVLEAWCGRVEASPSLTRFILHLTRHSEELLPAVVAIEAAWQGVG